jgi:hypothetical protein
MEGDKSERTGAKKKGEEIKSSFLK